MNKVDEIKTLCIRYIALNSEIEELNTQVDDKVTELEELIKNFKEIFGQQL